MMALHSDPGDRAFEFDPVLVATSRPQPLADAPEPASQRLSRQDLTGLLTAVAAVPATALVLIFAAVTAYGPLSLDGYPARIAAAPLDVETTGSTGWQLRGSLPD